jgi:hypothetical protein
MRISLRHRGVSRLYCFMRADRPGPASRDVFAFGRKCLATWAPAQGADSRRNVRASALHLLSILAMVVVDLEPAARSRASAHGRTPRYSSAGRRRRCSAVSGAPGLRTRPRCNVRDSRAQRSSRLRESRSDWCSLPSAQLSSKYLHAENHWAIEDRSRSKGS